VYTWGMNRPSWLEAEGTFHCDLCDQEVPLSRQGPHLSVHTRQAQARYEYPKGPKKPHEWKVCPVCGETKLIPVKNQTCSRRCSRLGELNPAWLGDDALASSARFRAHYYFGEMPELCEDCGQEPPKHRHHIDENTYNNDPSNITFLCVKCHRRRHRHPRPACERCGRACPRPTAKFCSRECWRLQKGGQ